MTTKPKYKIRIVKESNHLFVKNPEEVDRASSGVHFCNSHYSHRKGSWPLCNVVDSLFLKEKKRKENLHKNAK